MKPLDEVIDQVVRVYSQTLSLTLLPAAIGAFVGGVPMAMVLGDLPQPPTADNIDWSIFGWAWSFQIVVSLVVQGMLLKMIAMHARNGVVLPAGEALQAAVAMLPAMLVATLVYLVLTIALTLLLILPGIWMLVMGIFYAPAIAIGGCDAMTSLQRSRALVRGVWWRTFGVFMLAALVAMIGYLLLATLVTPLANAAFGGGWTTEAALTTVVGALFTPLINTLLVVLYLEYSAREGTPPAPSAPPPTQLAA